MHVRLATDADDPRLLDILLPMIRGGETYSVAHDLSPEEAIRHWRAPGNEVWVAELEGRVVGTYYLRPNQAGGGAHVANCGFVTGSDVEGKGVARAMCAHSLERASERGFLAVQYNFVVATNVRAIRLWKSFGFEVVGRLPRAFRSPSLGLVDALVMRRDLATKTSTAASRTLDVHFDFVSPYAYVGWTQMRAIAKRHDARLRPIPTLFAGLLTAHGNVGPAEIPAKRAYIFKDAYRKAAAHGLPPLTPPPAHPFNPLLALRVAGAVDDVDLQCRVIDELYASTWAGGVGCESRDAVSESITRAGLDAQAVLTLAESAESKARLRIATDAAIAAGVFGVPTVRVGGELFFGVDSLPALEAYLRGEDPWPKGAEARFRDLPSSAQRKRG